MLARVTGLLFNVPLRKTYLPLSSNSEELSTKLVNLEISIAVPRDLDVPGE